MKLRNFLILLAVVLAGSSSVTAHPCTESTIKGDYAFSIHGQIVTPNGTVVINGIAKTET